MSRYHSVCETCGMEDTNNDPEFEDCGHPFWAIVEHIEEIRASKPRIDGSPDG